MSEEMDKGNWQQLEDKGWTAMSHTLDQVMPHKKRRGLIWFVVAGMVLLTIAGIAIADRDSTLQPDALETSPSSSSEMATSIHNPQASRVKPPTTAEQQQTNELQVDPSTVASTESPAGKVDLQSRTAVVYDYEDDATLVDVEDPEMHRIDELDLPSTEKASEPHSIAETTKADETSSKVAMVVDLLPSPDLHVYSLRDDKVEPIASQKAKSSRVYVELQSGLSSDFGFQAAGLHLGAQVHYSFSSRWSLASGLRMYRIRQPYLFSASPSTLDAGRIVVQSNSSFFSANENDFINTEDQSFTIEADDALHYLQIPFHIHYQISPRWGLFGGFASMQLLNSRRDSDQALENATPIMSNNTTRVQNIRSGESLFKKSNFSAVTGINYRWRKIGVGLEASWLASNHLNYDLEASERLKNKAEQNLNRLHLHLMYRF